MADLKPAEVDKAKLHFDIYDFEGSGKVDAFHLGDLLRSLDLVPTQEAVLKAGGVKKKGEKYLSLEEFLPIFSQLKKEKEKGAYEDFMEGLKVYDKMENGTMLEAELAHILQSLGEKLSDPECEEIFAALGFTPDEEGNIPYEPFIKKLMAGPFPEANADKK
ncbi:Myosin light chain alkali [Fragariocoptes setiger]|uniref:Myosin light chain alkali n=1 Tax=Fragariocoptes setiger TaxID=1670756 RepID=A0ABQ7SD32_9ACAR|nr:Myosin light chain alkali [Fragariocoptes setiger]